MPSSAPFISVRQCPDCSAERIFERPPCVDDHGPDCPEWACAECGAALVTGFHVDLAVGVAVTARNAA